MFVASKNGFSKKQANISLNFFSGYQCILFILHLCAQELPTTNRIIRCERCWSMSFCQLSSKRFVLSLLIQGILSEKCLKWQNGHFNEAYRLNLPPRVTLSFANSILNVAGSCNPGVLWPTW